MKYWILFLLVCFQMEVLGQGNRIELVGGQALPLFNFGSSDIQNSSAYFAEGVFSGGVRYGRTSEASNTNHYMVLCPGDIQGLLSGSLIAPYWFVQYEANVYGLLSNDLNRYIENSLSRLYNYSAKTSISSDNSYWVEHSLGLGVKAVIDVNVLRLFPYFIGSVGLGYMTFPQVTFSFLDNMGNSVSNEISYSSAIGISSNMGVGLAYQYYHQNTIFAECLGHNFYGIDNVLQTTKSSNGNVLEKKLTSSFFSLITQIGLSFYF